MQDSVFQSTISVTFNSNGTIEFNNTFALCVQWNHVLQWDNWDNGTIGSNEVFGSNDIFGSNEAFDSNGTIGSSEDLCIQGTTVSKRQLALMGSFFPGIIS